MSEHNADYDRGVPRGGADVVGITPSDQFVPPTLNLDGPPDADVQTLRRLLDDPQGLDRHQIAALQNVLRRAERMP